MECGILWVCRSAAGLYLGFFLVNEGWIFADKRLKSCLKVFLLKEHEHGNPEFDG